MADMSLADRANEAAHEAVLEVLRSTDFVPANLMGNGGGKSVAKNLIDLHKDLAAYYRSLEEEQY
ncbi:hypothetical protein C7446_2334 [Kushneria sinocarnis]|uniref:Uncharacterized protein n=1 Tax=Kushneria sinocarnis TaxID=595502 RepID=A0A420WVN5_9GAMM|nr:hypothetical protein C7446_2334 [Kushneria sinocarnis]